VPAAEDSLKIRATTVTTVATTRWTRARIADTMTPSRNMMIDEEHTMLTDALERLPEYHRVVLQLFWFEKLSHAEIARRMQRTEVAARKMLSRAKAQLGLEIERIKRDRD
jgi:RNA polymerase sigma factor (sigma-70 family)